MGCFSIINQKLKPYINIVLPCLWGELSGTLRCMCRKELEEVLKQPIYGYEYLQQYDAGRCCQVVGLRPQTYAHLSSIL